MPAQAHLDPGVGIVSVRKAVAHHRVPGRQPIGKAFALSFAVLLAVTVLTEVPGKFLNATGRPMHYLLIATVINALRSATLGLIIGFVRSRSAGREHHVAS